MFTETISSLRVGNFIQSQVYSTKADSCEREKRGGGGKGRDGEGWREGEGWGEREKRGGQGRDEGKGRVGEGWREGTS